MQAEQLVVLLDQSDLDAVKRRADIGQCGEDELVGVHGRVVPSRCLLRAWVFMSSLARLVQLRLHQ